MAVAIVLSRKNKLFLSLYVTPISLPGVFFFCTNTNHLDRKALLCNPVATKQRASVRISVCFSSSKNNNRLLSVVLLQGVIAGGKQTR